MILGNAYIKANPVGMDRRRSRSTKGKLCPVRKGEEFELSTWQAFYSHSLLNDSEISLRAIQPFLTLYIGLCFFGYKSFSRVRVPKPNVPDNFMNLYGQKKE